MTFYQELQLDSAGSKKYISNFKLPKEKFIHICIFIFKVILNVVYSTAVIILCGIIFGFENCIAGLALLLGINVFRFTDLDIQTRQSIPVIYIIFGIFAFCPKIANLVPVGCDFCINFISILLILILGCHNVKWSNHSTLVLSYLLLTGSDVGGISYLKRVLCLLLGATLTALVLYRNRRKTKFEYGFKNLFTDFKLSDERSRWQIKFALCVSGAVLIASLIGFSKPAWSGIAAMSVTSPYGLIQTRVESRIRGNALGCIFLLTACTILPEALFAYLGVIGGLAAGFCSKYEGQTTWNSFSALSASVSVFGVRNVLKFRILNNILGAVFALLLGKIIDEILIDINNLIEKRKQKSANLSETQSE